jgi:hypothetical protein
MTYGNLLSVTGQTWLKTWLSYSTPDLTTLNWDGQTSAPCPLPTCPWFSLPLQSTADQILAIWSHFTSMHTSLHTCPISSCSWYTSSQDPDEVKDIALVSTHLVEIHESSHNMNTISDATFTSYDLHPYQVCNSPKKKHDTQPPTTPSKHPYSSWLCILTTKVTLN